MTPFKLLIPLLLMCSCSDKIHTIQTDKVYQTHSLGFSQAVASKHFVFSSGQVGWDNNFELAGLDFNEQFNQAIKNISIILKEVNLGWNDVLVLRFYIKNLDEDKRNHLGKFLKDTYKNDYSPATTMLGINALARENLLVEIEFIAKK